MRWLDGITSAMNMNLGKLRGVVRDREAWRPRGHKALTRLGNNYTAIQPPHPLSPTSLPS